MDRSHRATPSADDLLLLAIDGLENSSHEDHLVSDWENHVRKNSEIASQANNAYNIDEGLAIALTQWDQD